MSVCFNQKARMKKAIETISALPPSTENRQEVLDILAKLGNIKVEITDKLEGVFEKLQSQM